MIDCVRLEPILESLNSVGGFLGEVFMCAIIAVASSFICVC